MGSNQINSSTKGLSGEKGSEEEQKNEKPFWYDQDWKKFKQYRIN